MRPMLLACLVWLLLMPITPAPPARAVGFTVTSPLDAPDANPGDGICATAIGVCSLRAAVQEANATLGPDTITLAPGVYVLGIGGRGEDAAATGDLDVTRPLTIAGAGAGSTIIDGNAADRILHVIGPIAVQLNGLTLRNGSVPRPADISLDGGGGAIYVVGGGFLSLNNVSVSGNTATSGAIAIDDGGSLTATGSTFSGNTASFGAALFTNGSATIANTTISGNSASSSTVGGGGILIAVGANATISGSTLSGNNATNGGAIHTRGSLSLVNSTLSANAARNGGGGLYVGGGSATLSNATLNANSADVQGGGILNSGGSAIVRNSIVANSPSGGTCAGQVTSAGYNLDGAQTCAFAGPGDLAGINPQLGPLQNNGGTTMTHALLPLSPAIDAGNACESIDQRGQRRPTDGNGDGAARCDIGAFEAPGVSVPLVIPLPANAPATLSPAGTATPTSTASPASAPPTAAPARTAVPPTAVRVAAPPRPDEATATESATWVVVTEPTEAISADDDTLGIVQAGEWYVVIAEEDDWLLVASDPAWPFWIQEDERVEVHRP